MFGRSLIAASFALTALPLLAAARPAGATTLSRAAPPGIRLWTAHSDTYRRGERVRVYFRTERDAYVTVFRVDTDGRLRILFPRDPVDPNLSHGGETYTVDGVDNHDAFSVDDYPGVGYVFGVASQDPFDYDSLTSNDHWSLQAVSNLVDGRIHGDPYASLQDLVQRIVPEGYADYDTHLLPYYVEQRYDYPRFLCYDCHAYTPFLTWNPYAAFCSRYSLFVYYDPFYFYPSYWYPTRYYGGTNVVYVRPRFSGSQYVFKAPADRSVPSVVYRDRRGVGMQSAPADRGVRGADLGGVGSVAVPGGGRRTVDGGTFQSPGGVPAERQGVTGGAQQPGKRLAAPQAGQQPATPFGGPISRPSAAGDAARRYIGEPPSAAAAGVAQPRARVPEAKPQRDLAPEARPRSVYIDAGARAEPRATPQPQQRAQPPAAVARPEPRFIPQAQPRGQAGPAPSARGGGEQPRAAPRGESHPASSGRAPTLIRRRP